MVLELQNSIKKFEKLLGVSLDLYYGFGVVYWYVAALYYSDSEVIPKWKKSIVTCIEVIN